MATELQLGLKRGIAQDGIFTQPVAYLPRDVAHVESARGFREYQDGVLSFTQPIEYHGGEGSGPRYGSNDFRLGFSIPGSEQNGGNYVRSLFKPNRGQTQLFIQQALAETITEEDRQNPPVLKEKLRLLGISEIDYWDYFSDGRRPAIDEKWYDSVILSAGRFNVWVANYGWQKYETPWEKEYHWEVMHDDMVEKRLNPDYKLPDTPLRVSGYCITHEPWATSLVIDGTPTRYREDPNPPPNTLPISEQARIFAAADPYGQWLNFSGVNFNSVVKETQVKGGVPRDEEIPLEFAPSYKPVHFAAPVWQCTEARVTAIKIEELVHPEDLCRNCHHEISQGKEGKVYVTTSIKDVNETVAYNYRLLNQFEGVMRSEDPNKGISILKLPAGR